MHAFSHVSDDFRRTLGVRSNPG